MRTRNKVAEVSIGVLPSILSSGTEFNESSKSSPKLILIRGKFCINLISSSSINRFLNHSSSAILVINVTCLKSKSSTIHFITSSIHSVELTKFRDDPENKSTQYIQKRYIFSPSVLDDVVYSIASSTRAFSVHSAFAFDIFPHAKSRRAISSAAASKSSKVFFNNSNREGTRGVQFLTIFLSSR